MAIMLGTRNCGKGLLEEMNRAAFPAYVNTVGANGFLFKPQAPQDAAKALSWAMDCEHKRLTYTNEVMHDPNSTALNKIKLDGNLLKGFQSGGDTMLGRKLYQSEREFRVGIMNMNSS